MPKGRTKIQWNRHGRFQITHTHKLRERERAKTKERHRTTKRTHSRQSQLLDRTVTIVKEKRARRK